MPLSKKLVVVVVCAIFLVVLSSLGGGGYYYYKTTATTAPAAASATTAPDTAPTTVPATTPAALPSTSSLTSNYLCPLNVNPSSGLCVSLGANGQFQGTPVPYAKLLGATPAVGFVTPFTLKFGKSYLKGGMTYDTNTGQVQVPWPGLYEVKVMVTLDVNKMGYASITVNGGLRETYGRLFQSNYSDATNGWIGSNTYSFAAADKVGIVLIKQGSNIGSLQNNYQDCWWSIRYLSSVKDGDYDY